MSYIVIKTGEDGISISMLDKATLLERLEDGYYGDMGLDDVQSCLYEDADPMYWGTSLTIIKGEVVTPRVIKITTELDID